MSKYSENTTQFKDCDTLIDALIEMGYTRDQIEVHKEGQPLRDWHGNLTHYLGIGDCDKAEIIIRRNYVNQVMKSGASNDFGFRKTADGTYAAIISEYDSRFFTAPWLTKLKVNYAQHGLMRQATKKGLKFVGTKAVNGKRQLQFIQA